MANDRHVRRSGSDYVQAFLALLPQGQAWPRWPDSTLYKVCAGLSMYWGFVDSRIADFLEIESDPRKTIELLPEWERAWGLPNPCVRTPQGVEARRQALLVKMTMLGGQSREFFINVAQAIGYTVTITEYEPYICGISFCGDSRGVVNNPDNPFEYLWQLGPPEIRYYWTVSVSGYRQTQAHCGSAECGVTRLLALDIAEDLECLLEELKPGHSQIVFDYSDVGGLDFSKTYDSSYLALGIM